ncbi:uncharacterized protein [Magallana gigas]|uniref:uncharacterized protein isoform X1 n=1 Tax=Magallana gigas TaxID=29159 RepID=UPI00333E746E
MYFMFSAVVYFAFCSKFSVAISCDFDGTNTVADFNDTKFLGTWHELERTTFQWGENTWHSQVWVFKRGADGHLYMAYTGYSAQRKSCSSPQTGLLTHSGSGASYTLTSEGRYEAALRVAYTDYSNVALVYMCYAPEVLGTCDRNRVHVSLFSRSPSMSKAQRTILMSHIDLDCVENGHLHQATAGLCQEPIPSNRRSFVQMT